MKCTLLLTVDSCSSRHYVLDVSSQLERKAKEPWNAKEKKASRKLGPQKTSAKKQEQSGIHFVTALFDFFLILFFPLFFVFFCIRSRLCTFVLFRFVFAILSFMSRAKCVVGLLLVVHYALLLSCIPLS
jgi:hypothetical protein